MIFPQRVFYNDPEPVDNTSFAYLSLQLLTLPFSSLYDFQSSYLHAPSRPESWVGSSCPLFPVSLYYSFQCCYSHPPGTLEGPRSFQAFAQSPCLVSPNVEPWRLILSSSPASSLFPISFYLFGFLRFSANSLIRPADVYRPYQVSLPRTSFPFICLPISRFYKLFHCCAWRSSPHQWSQESGAGVETPMPFRDRISSRSGDPWAWRGNHFYLSHLFDFKKIRSVRK